MKRALSVIAIFFLLNLPGIHTSPKAQALDPIANLPTSMESEDGFFPAEMDPPEECGVPVS